MMSNFYCEHCGASIIEGKDGRYITECEHYPCDCDSMKQPPEDCYPETAECSKSELSDLLSAYRQLSADMAVLFARKKIQNDRIGLQTVGMETYRLIFTGSELDNIWRQMAEIEKLVNKIGYHSKKSKP